MSQKTFSRLFASFAVSLKKRFPNMPSSFARLPPTQAKIVLALCALLAIVSVVVALSPWQSSNYDPTRRREGDIPLYRAEIERIAGGENYYAAAADELTARGYPTKSIFNWRMPMPIALLGLLPNIQGGKILLGLLALMTMVTIFKACVCEETAYRGDRCVPWFALASVLLLTGPFLLFVLGNAFVIPLLWSSVLIALSLACYGVNRNVAGAMCGTAALFCSELAMPYCLLMAFGAWYYKNRREKTTWLLCASAWTVYFSLHAWVVVMYIAPDAHAHRLGWIQGGGLPFLLATAQINAYLINLPQGIAALYWVVALIGLAGWSTPWGTRVGLTATLYVILFTLVGQQFNQYWGALYTPILCLGAARFPYAIRDLLDAQSKLRQQRLL